MTYCLAGSKATINITSPINEKIIIDAPVAIQVTITNQGQYVDYTHSMNAPIDHTFSQPVTGVIINDPMNDYIYSGEYPPTDPRVHSQCPLPSIQANKIYLDFDPGAYADNSGTCTYRVYFGGWKLTATNNVGQVIERVYNQLPSFNVTCDDDFPEGFCKCSSPAYPGYCCLDCHATANEIRSITQSLKTHNNGR